MGSINIIVTILNMRAPGMTLMKMPMFAWTWLITAYLLIAVMPVLAGAITMTLTDRRFGTTFFNPAGGGDPVMYQHIFWFFGHPEVYIMILPAFGIISQVVPAFSRKRLFGYASMVYATSSIAILSFIVWAHHMFTTGMPVTGQLFFMYATMLIAVPTAVKIFNWIATMWQGSMTFETPMLFAVGFIFVFTIGGFTGLILAMAPIDLLLQDTYYVVAHFHYVLVAGSLFAMFAGAYYWMPKWTGVMYNETRGKIRFWWSLISFNVTFFPMHFLGLAGMPAATPTTRCSSPTSTCGPRRLLLRLRAGVLLLLRRAALHARPGQARRPAPWNDPDGKGAEGLEWEVPSPAPFHTFETPPPGPDRHPRAGRPRAAGEPGGRDARGRDDGRRRPQEGQPAAGADPGVGRAGVLPRLHGQDGPAGEISGRARKTGRWWASWPWSRPACSPSATRCPLYKHICEALGINILALGEKQVPGGSTARQHAGGPQPHHHRGVRRQRARPLDVQAGAGLDPGAPRASSPR